MPESFIAALTISLLSLSGVLFFGKSGHLKGAHRFIVPIAIGVFLGVIFFELIPETLHASEFYGSIAIVAGFMSFYILSHFLRTYHHHHDDHGHDDCENKRGASMLLIGDTIHNIADGVVIASAFLINPAVGIAATIGIALHEVPQEIAQYGVLIHAGYSKKKALFYNFLTSLSVFVGVMASTVFASFGEYLWILTGLAAGNLLYIAASDMIPELQESTHAKHFMKTFVSTLFGLIAITALLTWSHNEFAMDHEEDSHEGENIEILQN
jgi:zinc and cadmium transporter